jgi:hypothetical protein
MTEEKTTCECGGETETIFSDARNLNMGKSRVSRLLWRDRCLDCGHVTTRRVCTRIEGDGRTDERGHWLNDREEG